MGHFRQVELSRQQGPESSACGQLRLNEHGEAMEDMVAARAVVGALVAQHLQKEACTLKELLPGARTNVPGLLTTRVSTCHTILHRTSTCQ